MRRLVLALIAATAASALLFTPGADAHRVAFPSDVTVKYSKPDKKDPYAKGSFSGAVTSTKARCQKSRTVTVSLQGTDGSTQVIGSDVTDATGAWTLSNSAAPGTYYAEVSKRVFRKNKKHRHVCAADVSRSVKVK